MPELLDLLAEVNREFAICNSCRYCEGYCPVFPAAEEMPVIRLTELNLLSNLCHEYRACYQACMYAPPHEFAVNIPAVLSEARTFGYGPMTWPSVLNGALRHPWKTVACAWGLGLVAILLAVALDGGLTYFAVTVRGPGAFYRVLQANVMTIGGLALGILPVVLLVAWFWRSWKAMGGTPGTLVDPRGWWAAATDALSLRHMRGGGGGCFYPDQSRPSPFRRLLHHSVVVGFFLAFLATVAAAVMQHLLGMLPPYPLVSAPVLLGSAGGILLIMGCAGLLVLRSGEGELERTLSTPLSRATAISFLTLMLWIALSGMLLLILRGTSALGTMMVLHLTGVAGLFLTVPYGKLVHAVPRFAAIWRYHVRSAAGR